MQVSSDFDSSLLEFVCAKSRCMGYEVDILAFMDIFAIDDYVSVFLAQNNSN